MMNNNPTFGGPGKRSVQFKTRMPVGKIPKVPRLGNKLNVPVFGNRSAPNQATLASTPAFRGPAKLPSNFMKNIPLLGHVGRGQSQSARANMFNFPLRQSVPLAGHATSFHNIKKVKKTKKVKKVKRKNKK